MIATNREMEAMKAQSEAQRKAVLAASGGSVDRRDGVEAAAAEIVMLYVGFPSLSEHTRVCGIIRKEIAERGIRPLNTDYTPKD